MMTRARVKEGEGFWRQSHILNCENLVLATYREHGQLDSIKQNITEHICVDSEAGHAQDELDDANGDEASGRLWEMLAAHWPRG